MFQSAPLTKARGDFIPGRPFARWCGFNPLPSQKQGETKFPSSGCHLRGVSIRSPHKSKGRRASSRPTTPSAAFQSAPLTKARGDRREYRYQCGQTTVSIRSPHKSKGRQPSPQKSTAPCGFQSAPLTKARGDLASRRSTIRPQQVSIRSPHKSKGRPKGVIPTNYSSMFQSAPLTKARGDVGGWGYDHAGAGFNPLPSQKQGETATSCGA